MTETGNEEFFALPVEAINNPLLPVQGVAGLLSEQLLLPEEDGAVLTKFSGLVQAEFQR